MASSEFDLIRQYFHTPCGRSDVVLGTGDDCAVVTIPGGRQLALTTDTLVDGVHFPADTAPEAIAHKAVAVNLSDLAAMGAEPAWLTLALTLPDADRGWIEAFAASFMAIAERYRVQLVGGDTTSGPLSVTVQALGLLDPERCMRRDRARFGDAIYVSGTLGDAAAGLRLLQQDHVIDTNGAWLIDRLNRPEPRVELGLKVAEYCRCAIDISDGLAADLGHILAASHCGATVYMDRLPLSHPLVDHSLGREGVGWELVLSGGDDYELCLLVAPADESRLMEAASDLSLPLTRIGMIEQHSSLNIVDPSGARYLPDRPGYEHFSK